MPIFRKKPLELECMQWFKMGDHSAVEQLSDRCYVMTLEGAMSVMPGDWIIKGIENEYYVCSGRLFERLYDPILVK